MTLSPELRALKIHFSFLLPKEYPVMKMSTLSLWTHKVSHSFCHSLHLACYLGWQLPSAADPTGNGYIGIQYPIACPSHFLMLSESSSLWLGLWVSKVHSQNLCIFLPRVSRNLWILSHHVQAMCTKEFFFRLCNEVPNDPHLCTTMPTPCWKLHWAKVLRSKTVETIFFNIYLDVSKAILSHQWSISRSR